MCEQCDTLQTRIHQYCRFLAQPYDAVTIERFAAAVDELEAQIAALHPEDEQGSSTLDQL